MLDLLVVLVGLPILFHPSHRGAVASILVGSDGRIVALLLLVHEAELLPDRYLVGARSGFAQSLFERALRGLELPELGQSLALVVEWKPVVGILAGRLFQSGHSPVVVLATELGSSQQHQIVVAAVGRDDFLCSGGSLLVGTGLGIATARAALSQQSLCIGLLLVDVVWIQLNGLGQRRRSSGAISSPQGGSTVLELDVRIIGVRPGGSRQLVECTIGVAGLFQGEGHHLMQGSLLSCG